MDAEPRFDAIVVGAGPAGTAAAWTLATGGQRVLALDKGHRPGGRCSVAYGCPADGWAAPTPGVAAFLAAAGLRPGDVHGFAAALDAAGVTTWTRARVVALSPDPGGGGRGGWTVRAEDGHAATAAALVAAIPAPQLAELVAASPDLDPALARALIVAARPVVYRPQWTLIDEVTGVAHADPAWSAAHAEDDPADVAVALGGTPGRSRAHRWRYSRVDEPAALAPGRFAADHALAVCGDWTDRDGVVAALGTGLLAGAVLTPSGAPA